MADDGIGLPPGRRALRGDSFTGVCRVARDLGLGKRTVRRAIAAGEMPLYNGLMPHDRLMKTIELFWTKVLPRVTDVR